MATECTNGKSLSPPFTKLLIFSLMSYFHILWKLCFSFVDERVVESLQDAPLAFAITVVVNSTSQSRTRVNEDANRTSTHDVAKNNP